MATIFVVPNAHTQGLRDTPCTQQACGLVSDSGCACVCLSYPPRFGLQFAEDRIYRHLEPALAFQLELSRMRNFDLTAVPCANHKMHLYLGAAKVKEGVEVTDHRFFIRAIIRHSDLITKVKCPGVFPPPRLSPVGWPPPGGVPALCRALGRSLGVPGCPGLARPGPPARVRGGRTSKWLFSGASWWHVGFFPQSRGCLHAD